MHANALDYIYGVGRTNALTGGATHGRRAVRERQLRCRRHGCGPAAAAAGTSAPWTPCRRTSAAVAGLPVHMP
jgi:hypothetical protein